MSNQIITLDEIEHKVGKKNNPYLKINKSLFVWDAELISQIQSRVGHAINVEIRDGEFPAIVKILNGGVNQDKVEHVDMSKPISKPIPAKVSFSNPPQSLGSVINRQSALKSAVAFYSNVEDKSVDVLIIADKFLKFIEDRE